MGKQYYVTHLKSKIEQFYCQHEIKKITKMIPKYFLVFLLSTITICHCHYTYHSGYHYNTRSNMVWFEANEPEDCREAPEEVSEEALPTDICDGAAAKDKRCFCIGYNYTTYFYGQPQESSGEVTYLPWCGVCRDPCALQFKWDASFTILPEEEEEEGSGAMEVIEDVAEEVAEVVEEADDVVEEVADAAEIGRSIDVSDIINDIAEEVAEVSEEVADVAEEAADVVEETADTVEEASAEVSEEVADVAEEAADVVEETADTVEEASNDLAEEAAGIVEEVTEAADVVEEVVDLAVEASSDVAEESAEVSEEVADV